MRACSRIFAVAVFCLGLPSFARADVGLPMIIVEWPFVILALGPVILVEAAVYRKRLGIPYGKALYPAGIANLVSTFIGYPLAWILRLIGQLVVVLLLSLAMQVLGVPETALGGKVVDSLLMVGTGSAWMGPGAEDALWMLPAALLVGLVPAYFVSVYSEAWVLRRMMKGEDKTAIRALSYRANLASYAFLAVIAVVILVRLLLHPRA
jgi:hypothetical protein